MNTIHTDCPEVRALVARAFPDYKGRRFTVEVFQGPMALHSYWSGGSRDYFAFVSMAGLGRLGVPENGTPWNPPLGDLVELPPNVALIRRTMGSYESVTIYVRPENLNSFSLPAPAELSRDERIVLIATRSLKNTYGGRTNIRFTEANEYTGITEAAWKEAQKACQAKGYLNHAFAITDKGRNAVPGLESLWQFKAREQEATAPLS